MKIVAATSLPAVDRPNADRWNAARSRQFLCQHPKKKFSIVKQEKRKIEYLYEFSYHIMLFYTNDNWFKFLFFIKTQNVHNYIHIQHPNICIYTSFKLTPQ